MSEIITVIGATGKQGSGVVSALLDSSNSSSSSKSYTVRAVSSDPSGSKAQALLSAHPSAVQSGQLQVVQGDLRDVESLKRAFEGAYGVFAACPFIPAGGIPAEQSDEYKQGLNIVHAAKVRRVRLSPTSLCYCPRRGP